MRSSDPFWSPRLWLAVGSDVVVDAMVVTAESFEEVDDGAIVGAISAPGSSAYFGLAAASASPFGDDANETLRQSSMSLAAWVSLRAGTPGSVRARVADNVMTLVGGGIETTPADVTGSVTGRAVMPYSIL